MTQEIISYGANGIFNSGKFEFQAVTDDVMYADIKDCKDSVIMLVNIPFTATGKYTLEFLPADESAGDNGVKVALISKSANIVFFTTKGIKTNDGKGYFKITAANGSNVSDVGIELTVIKHTPVINH